MKLISVQENEWLKNSLELLQSVGCAVVTDVLSRDFCDEVKKCMYKVKNNITSDVGLSRLERAGEFGVLRLMMLYDPIFFKFLEIRELLAIIDRTVSPTCIMHTQNGFILPSTRPDFRVFQNTFHQDFPRVLNGYMASINVFFAIDEFTEGNGSTQIVLGTHQRMMKPSEEFMNKFSEPVICPSGSMVVFDSTLWHAAGLNISNEDRLAINHQFTRSYFKQQIDYVRALGDSLVLTLPPRTQQLLGYYSRVATSFDEYYKPEGERCYRSGQDGESIAV